MSHCNKHVYNLKVDYNQNAHVATSMFMQVFKINIFLCQPFSIIIILSITSSGHLILYLQKLKGFSVFQSI